MQIKQREDQRFVCGWWRITGRETFQMTIFTLSVALLTLPSIITARHHVVNRGHLVPPIREPFFPAGIETVGSPDLKGSTEREVKRSSAQESNQMLDRGSHHKMPPPKGPLRDVRPPLLSSDAQRHEISTRERGTFHAMPPPRGALREMRPPLAPFEANCGHSSPSSSRVVNGDNAVLGEWPWQAWLQFNNDLVCGGTLITPEWVMTAAHCVLYDDPNKFRVILGDVDRSKTEGSEELFTIKRIIKHRLFSHPVPYENDIALFQLSRPARLGSLINTACLPEFLSEVPVGTKCFISGWGQMFHEGTTATILQQAPMPVVSNSACAAKLDTSARGGLQTRDNRTWVVTSKMMCAGDAGKTETHGCFGDSGGPFQCVNTAGQWVVHGIVSWGDPDCSSRNHYTVFTRVSVFRRWIDSMIQSYGGS